MILGSVAWVLLSAAGMAEPPLVDFTAERLAYRRTVTARFEKGETTALEEEARKLRATRPRFSSGTPKLFDFYSAFDPGSTHIPDSQKEAYAARLGQWSAAHPGAFVPTMAAIKVAKYRAYKARGTGYADSVTEEGRRVHNREQQRAWDLAVEAEKLGPGDPALYDEMLMSCKDLAKPRSELDSIFAKAMKVDPTFDQLYVTMTNYLFPRWHGSAAELHDFALQATERSRSSMGAIPYARIAMAVMLMERRSLVQDYPFQYPRIKEAFQELDRRYPNSGRTVNFYAWLSLVYGDAATAMPLMERIAGSWNADAEEVWGGRQKFDLAMTSARGMLAR